MMRSDRRGAMGAVLLCALALFGFIQGNEAARPADMPPGGQVQAAYMLPEHPSKEFPAGDWIPVLVTIHNDGSNPYDMSYIMGSLNAPNEFSFYVQNFTYTPYQTTIPSKQEVTFQYKFRPDKSLRPMELRVALTMFYRDSQGSTFSTTFFNETADIVDKPKVVDYEAIMMLVVMLAIFGAAAYGALAWFGTLNVVKKASGKKSKGGKPAGEGSNDDWLQGTPHARMVASQKPKAGKTESKKQT